MPPRTLTVDGTTIGGLNVYGAVPGAFDAHLRETLTVFAAQAAAALAMVLRHERQERTSAQLEHALMSRAVIDQALGILMAQQRCTAEQALSLLRAHSQNSNRKLRDIAEDLVRRVSGAAPSEGTPSPARTTSHEAAPGSWHAARMSPDTPPRAAGADDAHRLVVLLDDAGRAVGTARKDEVHTHDTPLHLAFSCWIFDRDGRTLLTRRSPAKVTWPGIWTNSFCGHPSPGEDLEDAVHRRAWDELGTRLAGVRSALPGFRYRAVSASGIVENEVCPVYTARLASALDPHPDEVADLRWVTLDELRADVGVRAGVYSPWLLEQLGGLTAPGG